MYNTKLYCRKIEMTDPITNLNKPFMLGARLVKLFLSF